MTGPSYNHGLGFIPGSSSLAKKTFGDHFTNSSKPKQGSWPTTLAKNLSPRLLTPKSLGVLRSKAGHQSFSGVGLRSTLKIVQSNTPKFITTPEMFRSR